METKEFIIKMKRLIFILSLLLLSCTKPNIIQIDNKQVDTVLEKSYLPLVFINDSTFTTRPDTLK